VTVARPLKENIDPDLFADLGITRVEKECSSSHCIVSRVFCQYIGHQNDEVVYAQLSKRDDAATAPKVVLLLNRTSCPEGAPREIIKEIIITALGEHEPEFVAAAGCTNNEFISVLEQIPKDRSGCTLY